MSKYYFLVLSLISHGHSLALLEVLYYTLLGLRLYTATFGAHREVIVLLKGCIDRGTDRGTTVQLREDSRKGTSNPRVPYIGTAYV
jgi:hypothetical protein